MSFECALSLRASVYIHPCYGEKSAHVTAMSRWGSSALCGNILYIHIYIYHVYTLLYADWKTGRRGVYRTSVAAPEDQRTRKLNPKALEIDLCIATHGYTWLLSYSLGIEARRGQLQCQGPGPPWPQRERGLFRRPKASLDTC